MKKQITRNPLVIFTVFLVFILTAGVMSVSRTSALVTEVELVYSVAVWIAMFVASLLLIARWLKHDRKTGFGTSSAPERIRRWILDLPDDDHRIRK
jgi:hypothetical protein